MPIYLRQSTASQEVPLGYFVSSTDGVTPQTGLTIANTDIKLWANGATTLANKNSGGATHIAGGVYYCVLDATDTATIGPFVIFINVSGALAVRVECVVLAANVFDTLFGTTALSTYAGGAVASVTAGVTVATNNDKTGYSLAANQHVIVDSGTVTTVTNPVDISATSGNALVSATAAATATAVWSATTRTLSAFAFSVTLTSDYDPAKTAAQASELVKVLAAVYDSLTASGNTLTLSNGKTQTVDAAGNRTLA
ncbi:hypothetical protein VT84_17090 [Gemmata sp. SH-PL17]|uniref:hypothetical protein n=1 Tax=Gemmata sp. SH-PL17 TaxID=1630693 RepID=UPI00078BC1B7|nr:hypothetical protein [Gemmata sp. SH-PL17]AMV26117.1 hypothetical protein VT84_17090 [Gemmata sp. SH-PL17]